MDKKSLDDLLQEGWQVRPGAKRSYINPSEKIINQRRDLSPEKQEHGDELFPGRRKVSRVTNPAPVPVVINASLSSQDTAPVPSPSHASTTDPAPANIRAPATAASSTEQAKQELLAR